MKKLPQLLKPELAQIGDRVLVEFKSEKGIVLSKMGTIAKRVDHGRMRQYLTKEGAVIFSWDSSRKDYKLWLFERTAINDQLPLAENEFWEIDNDRLA